MTETVQLYLISGVSALGLVLLSAIYSELKTLSSELKVIVAAQSGHSVKIDNLEKIIDKLPCAQMTCGTFKG